MIPTVPRVAVLLATYNGGAIIAQQVDSIRRQVSCSVDIWVSDDQSTDGTWEWMCERSKSDPHIILLPRTGRFGNAAKNFYRLLSDVDFSGYDYIALSDQDDIWFSDKLAVSVSRIREGKASAASSNVIAMWPNGTKSLISKSQQQRRMDFMFESAGPGCTYVLAVDCAAGFKQFLTENRAQVDAVQFHDWMLYAWVRSRGYAWHIESTPTMYYRQHESNEYGANVGWAALRKRISQVRSGWYRDQIVQISRLVAGGAFFTQECAATAILVGNRSFFSRMKLAAKASELRRSLRDRAWLVVACLVGGI
jgi:rhamnosyltransferase